MTWTNVKVDSANFPLIDHFSDLAIGADGSVYLTWMRCSATGPTGDCGGTKAMIMFSKSLDGGMTWSAPVMVAFANLAPDSCGAYYGCLPNTSERVSNVPAVDVDRTSGPFSNRLYVAFYHWSGSRLQLNVSRSHNGGATWLDRRLDPSDINDDAFATTSNNGGVSFSPAVRLSTVSSDPFNDGFGSGEHALRLVARHSVWCRRPRRSGRLQDLADSTERSRSSWNECAAEKALRRIFCGNGRRRMRTGAA